MIVELPKSTTNLHQPQSSRGLLPPQVLYSCMSSSADLTRAFFRQNFSKRLQPKVQTKSKWRLIIACLSAKLHKTRQISGSKKITQKNPSYGVLGPTYSWQKDQQLCFPAYYYTNTCIIADLEDPVSEIL
jgi:hypothetical protein